MATDWAFEELGTRAFEQLSVALAVALLGPGVEVYGSGTDGGREATYTGAIEWPAVAGGAVGPDEAWTGYTVVQAKQCERPTSPSRDLAWLKGQVRGELDTWASGERSKLPDNLLFVTNARLSAKDVTGGIDEIKNYISSQLDRDRVDGEGRPVGTLRRRGLAKVHVWHRDMLNAIVSANSSIRDAFPALLTVGDLLSRLTTLHPGKIDPQQLAPLLVDHAQSTLRNEQWLRFDEAGDTPESRHQIDKAIVDLPAKCDGQRIPSLISEIVNRADLVARKTVWQSTRPRHLVITGAPGNGKSTVAKYLTQVYRANFIRREANQDSIIDLIERTEKSLERIRVSGPKNPRWALRVDLADMANDMGPSGGPNIKRWLSDLVTRSTELSVEPASLSDWMQAWPTLLIFDGYDEVTMPQHRHRVVDEITGLLEWSDAKDADLMIVITTRRTGYTERFIPDEFDQIDLDELTASEAAEYASHITSQRLDGDQNHRLRILERFDEAAKNAAVERLLRTPLQVLIMTIILGGSGDLPTTRYQLFWNYFDTVFKREANKSTANRSFFRDHRSAIVELHQIVGLILQIRCEETDESVAKMPRSELFDIAQRYMREDEHDETTVAAFSERIFDVATQRLVLLTADQNDTVSFDVRSLQELMAGTRLVGGADEQTRVNLEMTALSPHWRNTWLFAAGKMANDSRPRRQMLLEIVETCDDIGNWPAWLCPTGPELAANLLEDGLAADRPKDQKRLIEVVLRCLQGPLPLEPRSVASALQLAAARSQIDSQHIRNAIRKALGATGERSAIAKVLMKYGQYGLGPIPGAYTEKDLQRAVEMWTVRLPKFLDLQEVSVAELIRPTFDELAPAIEPAEAQLVERAMEDLEALKLCRTREGDLWPIVDAGTRVAPSLDEVLDSSEASDLLRVCLGSLGPSEDWAASAVVTRVAAAMRSRRAVGALLSGAE
ncbi:NACHT domain-containing protein [Gordonia sp. VNK21]|uniref:NACHT domain-containing protein n=1 Tax=Gordonia sp. VNK21 TaxID=3382483 RepID=UPI0038D37104